jgi:hypothetical protein
MTEYRIMWMRDPVANPRCIHASMNLRVVMAELPYIRASIGGRLWVEQWDVGADGDKLKAIIRPAPVDSGGGRQ